MGDAARASELPGPVEFHRDVPAFDTAKPTREFPRLCRGGSKSLTYPAVDSLGPSTRLQTANRQGRDRGVPTMDDHESLRWTKQRCKYAVRYDATS